MEAFAADMSQANNDGFTIDTSGVRVRPLIPQGEHVLTLQQAEVKRIPSNWPDGGDGKADKLMFAFTSQMTGLDGKPYEYTVWTGKHYGDKRAALTLLLDMLIPGLTRGMKVRIADLVGKSYKAHIQHKTNANTGKVYAAHLYMLPFEVVPVPEATEQSPVAALVPQPDAATLMPPLVSPPIVMATTPVPVASSGTATGTPDKSAASETAMNLGNATTSTSIDNQPSMSSGDEPLTW